MRRGLRALPAVVALLLLACAQSRPTNEVLPDISLQQLTEQNPHLRRSSPRDSARSKIQLLQGLGFDNTQCDTLAGDAITGMTSTLQVEQNALDALPDGAHCLITIPVPASSVTSLIESERSSSRSLLSGVTVFQQLLDDSARDLADAKADLGPKETAYQAKQTAAVTFTMLQNTIGDDLAAIGQSVVSSSEVAAALQELAVVKATRDTANTLVVGRQASFDAAKIAAQDASKACLCAAKKVHADTWARAQLVVADNDHSWKEAHHIKCALDGSVTDACVVPAFSLTNKVLAAEATAITSCTTSAPITAPTDAPTTAPSNVPTGEPTTDAPTTDAPTTPAPTMAPYWQSQGGQTACATGYTTITDSSDCTAALVHISGTNLVPRTGSHPHHPIGCFVATGNTQDLFLNDPGAGTQEGFTYEDSSILCKFGTAA